MAADAADTLGAAPPVWLDRMRDRAPGHFTDADLEALPEGYGYELVDGVLIVSPAPSKAHQQLLGRLYVQLVEASPAELAVMLAPFDFKPDPDSTWQPDLLVAVDAEIGEKRLEGRPLLVVEIRSGRGLKDRALKKVAYEEAGVPTYWLVDPIEPSLTVLELDDDGRYVETARLVGDGSLPVVRPFPVAVSLV